MSEIVSKTEAKELGLSRYFDGIQCPNGHIALRFVRNGGCQTCAYARAKKYHSRNPEQRKAIRKKSWLLHREQRNLDTKAWREKNPSRHRAIQRKGTKAWRAKQRGAPGQFTDADVADLLKLQKYKCGYCRMSLRSTAYHVDHIVPLSKGGTNFRSNIQILCIRGNCRKGAKDPFEYARSIGCLL